MRLPRGATPSLLALLLAGCGESTSPPVTDGAPAHDRLKAMVETSTGWNFKAPPLIETIDRSALGALLSKNLEGAPGRRVAATGRALVALDLLPAGFRLLDSLRQAYTEELLALYVFDAKKVFLVKEALDGPLSSADQQLRKAGKLTTRELTIAHELVHVLQQQHDPAFDILSAKDADIEDVQAAFHALTEGEALVQMIAAGGEPLGDALYFRVLGQMQDEAMRKHASAPPLLRRLLYHPYLAGFEYVRRKVGSAVVGSAPRVHAGPPLSTEQLLHADKQTDPPLAVFLPDLASSIGGGRVLVDEAVLGEMTLAQLFRNSRGFTEFPATPLDEGLEWGGDRLHLYEKSGGSAPVVVHLSHWDHPRASLAAVARLSHKPRLHAFRDGLRVAVVTGLEAPEAAKVAREALGRAVAKPFKSVAELRALRTSLVFPASASAPLPLIDDLAPVVDVFDHPAKLHGFAQGLGSHRWSLLTAAVAGIRGKSQHFTWPPGADEVDWTMEEVDILARGKIIGNPRGQFGGKLAQGFELHGANWPEFSVQAVVAAVAAGPQSGLIDFLKKHGARREILREALRLTRGLQEEPVVQVILLKGAEAGQLRPQDVGLQVQEPFPARYVRACLLAAATGRITWTPAERAFFEQGFDHATPLEPAPEIFDNWDALPLTPHGKGTFLARFLMHPARGKEALPLLLKEASAPKASLRWERFALEMNGKPAAKSLPHCKEIVGVLEGVCSRRETPADLKRLLAWLRN